MLKTPTASMKALTQPASALSPKCLTEEERGNEQRGQRVASSTVLAWRPLTPSFPRAESLLKGRRRRRVPYSRHVLPILILSERTVQDKHCNSLVPELSVHTRSRATQRVPFQSDRRCYFLRIHKRHSQRLTSSSQQCRSEQFGLF